MLRLTSVIGIAIAMVIGFIAISSQMKDDFTVRSRIVDVIKQMKEIADEELQCKTHRKTTRENTAGKSGSSSTTDIKMVANTELLPLEGEQSQPMTPDSSNEQANNNEDSATNNENEAHDSSTEIAAGADTADSPTEPVTAESTTESGEIEQIEEFENPDIIQAMGYRTRQNGVIEVITVLKDVHGDSGKLRVKAGSKLIILCSCKSQALFCKIQESSINKNYIPKNISKK